jgi:hypothetical protein
MPLYSYACQCGKKDDRYVRLCDFEKLAHNQFCECGKKMRKLVTVPVLAGLDSGPEGFLRGRIENDGCSDNGMRARLRRNAKRAGIPIEGGTFVPGLCRRNVPEDPQAVVHSRSELIRKARAMNREIHGPGIDVETSIPDEFLAKAERPYRASVDCVLPNVIDKVREEHGGTVTKRKFREMIEHAQDVASGNG